MRRDIFWSKPPVKLVLQWLLSFAIAVGIFLSMMLILTLIQKKWMLNEGILRLILLGIITITTYICAYTYRRLSKLKGVVCGLITAGIFSVVKLIMSFSSKGIGKGSFAVYICLFCAGILGGILAANKKSKRQRQLGKINKS